MNCKRSVYGDDYEVRVELNVLFELQEGCGDGYEVRVEVCVLVLSDLL